MEVGQPVLQPYATKLHQLADSSIVIDDLVEVSAMQAAINERGLPAGGTSGQVLAKSSVTDYAVNWVDQSGGGVSATDLNDVAFSSAQKINTYGSSQTNAILPALYCDAVIHCCVGNKISRRVLNYGAEGVWSTTGTLPTGLRHKNGVIDGTPTAAGTYSFSVVCTAQEVPSLSHSR